MTYYVDGFNYHGNPSPTGGGYTIFDEAKLIKRQEILKPGLTNNEAELLAVLAAAQLADEKDTIYTDSMNTIYWCRSGKPKARPDLKDQANAVKRLLYSKKLKLKWIPREQNLAGFYNDAYDQTAS